MRVLIIEDDEEKIGDLIDWVRSSYDSPTVLQSRSLHTGKSAALDDSVDLILLDMTMRNYERSLEEEGGRPHFFAGREILRRMSRERVATPVIVVTQFDRFGDEDDFRTLAELKNELSNRFSNYIGTVHYRANVDDWRSSLNRMVDGLFLRRRD
jgi:CheY-like chemotaxis protein